MIPIVHPMSLTVQPHLPILLQRQWLIPPPTHPLITAQMPLRLRHMLPKRRLRMTLSLLGLL